MTKDAKERLLAVIPARGGSKRIQGKNIRDFRGIPLLGRTLRLVQESKIFSSIVVSTDDPQVARVALAFGGDVPFLRPSNLSQDDSPTAPVVCHAIDAVTATHGTFAAVCCIYPAAVLLRPTDFQKSRVLLPRRREPMEVVAAVVKYGHPIQRALRVEMGDLLMPRERTEIDSRTQDLEPMWHDAGQFYWATPDRWKDSTPILGRVIPYEVPSWRAQDIDTEADWRRAELLFSLLASGEYD